MPSARCCDGRVQSGDIPLEELPPNSLPAASSSQELQPTEHTCDEEDEPLLRDPSSRTRLGFEKHKRASVSGRQCRSRNRSAMEKINDSKVGVFLKKLEVDAEPGLTNAQLMLTNHDLKPGTIPLDGNADKRTLTYNYGSRTGTPPMGSLEFRGILDC